MTVFTEEKKKLLIEALSYIKSFNGKIVVIKYGGAAMIEEHLKHDFAQDIVLLQSLGMLPVIVHGGGAGSFKGNGTIRPESLLY